MRRRLPYNLRHLSFISPQLFPPYQSLQSLALKGKKLIELGATKSKKEKWVLPHGREMITKVIMRKIVVHLQRGSHWGPQAMCDMILRIYGVWGI
jgi:hypothetical protein